MKILKTKTRNLVRMGGFALLLAASGVYVACSSDENPSKSLFGTGNEINFRALGDRPVTKASSTVTGDITSFTLQGIWNGSAVPAEQRLFDAVVVTRSEDGTSWDYSPKKTWPATGAVRFFAYSPANSVNVTNGFKGDVDPTITYTVPVDPARQEDLLVAVTDELNAGTVPVNFKHALSRVLFRARSAKDDVPVKIVSVKLKNLYQTGTWKLEADAPATRTVGTLATDAAISTGVPTNTDRFQYASYTTYATNQMPEAENAAYLNYNDPDYKHFWQVAGTKTDFSVDLSTSNTVGGEYSDITGATQGLMVMPQATVYSSSTTTPNTGDFYVEVEYSVGGPDKKTKNIRVYDWWKKAWGSFTFEPGKQYTFDMTIDVANDVIKLNVNDLAAWTDVAVPKDYALGDVVPFGLNGEWALITELDSPYNGHGWALCVTAPMAFSTDAPNSPAFPGAADVMDAAAWAQGSLTDTNSPAYQWFVGQNGGERNFQKWTNIKWITDTQWQAMTAFIPSFNSTLFVLLVPGNHSASGTQRSTQNIILGQDDDATVYARRAWIQVLDGANKYSFDSNLYGDETHSVWPSDERWWALKRF